MLQLPGSQQYLITVNFSSNWKSTKLVVSDALGRQLLPTQFKRGQLLTFEVNLASFPVGIYLITLQTKTFRYSEKVVLSR